MMSKTSSIASDELVAPRVNCTFHDEPTIRFGCEREHVSPQAGLALCGPRFVEDDRLPSDRSHATCARANLIELAVDRPSEARRGKARRLLSPRRQQRVSLPHQKESSYWGKGGGPCPRGDTG